MEAIWGIGSFILVAGITFFTMWRLLIRRSDELALKTADFKTLEAERQTLALELASVRGDASRLAGLEEQAAKDNEKITDLERRCASLSTSIDEREKRLVEERAQVSILKADLHAQISRLTTKGESDADTITNLEKNISAMGTAIQEREKALTEERELLVQMKDAFKSQFAELSMNALKDNNEAFLHTAKAVLALQHKEADTDLAKRQEAITQLVKPLQDGIKAVGDAAKEMEGKREKAFGSIEEQLRQSVLQSAEVARQAGGLKDALKKPNVRGRWGEIQLKNCIEMAGMEEHCDVEFQVSSVSIEEDRIRPDMIVRMPGGRRIAVDAKTPMDPFLQYIEAATEEERNASLIRHGRIVKAHIAGLVKSDYMQKVAESPDFVVMFLPNESFLAMALEKEPTLMEDAISKKILITTPGTLIGLLKVIRYGWNEQRIAVNAQHIADEGAKLNTEITRFLEDFARLGLALRSASEAYDSSLKRVEKQITNTSNKLTNLGAKSRKALTGKAARMLTASGADEEEEENVSSEDEVAV